jgi:uncharacterized Tic20 family protein
MSVMTTALGGVGAPVVRRPVRTRPVATRPAGIRPVPARPAATRPVEQAPPAVIVEREVVARWQVAIPTVPERAWGVLAHLSGAFASAAGPLLVARVAGRRSEYVREQATAAANFQLAFLAMLAPFALVGVLTVGLAALFVVPLVLAWLLTTVLAATASAGGERYRYPVRLQLIRAAR